MKTQIRKTPLYLAVALAFAGTQASATSVYGQLGNFDVVNDTGGETHGFEIELEGISSADVYHTFNNPYIQYKAPTLINYNNGATHGVIVRYESSWDPITHTFGQTTGMAAAGYVPSSGSCYKNYYNLGYGTNGCEHFGVGLYGQATRQTYRWLAGDAATGALTPLSSIVALPAPVWSVRPAAPGAQPVIRAEFEIPQEPGQAYGDAYWVKIYKTEVDHQIDLNNLLLDDPLMANAPTEVEWELLQAKPGANIAMNEAELGVGSQAVLRRYEFYRYNNAWGSINTFDDNGVPTTYVDPANGEVLACVVNGCNAPTADELGRYIGRQMAGVNLAAVPLPAAYLLLMSGMGLLGMGVRRRDLA